MRKTGPVTDPRRRDRRRHGRGPRRTHGFGGVDRHLHRDAGGADARGAPPREHG